MSESYDKFGRIRWKCRRGMLELDMMLLPFFDKHFQQLSDKDKVDFEKLLDEQDPTIHRWLMNLEKPKEAWACAIVTRIRERR